jgi:hypothetical protein
MLFHVPIPKRGFSPDSGAKNPPRYTVSWIRVASGLLVFFILLLAAFVAHLQHWIEGATILLHMCEVIFGGIVGLLFGEKVAIDSIHRE